MDFIVRGEGDITFRDLLRASNGASRSTRLPGLSIHDGNGSRTTRRDRSADWTMLYCAP